MDAKFMDNEKQNTVAYCSDIRFTNDNSRSVKPKILIGTLLIICALFLMFLLLIVLFMNVQEERSSNSRVSANSTVTFDSTEGTISTVSDNSTAICLQPPQLENAAIVRRQESTSGYSVGYILRYRCLPGFVQNGNITRMCNGSGKWEESINVQCNPVNCSFPILIENGWLVGDKFDFKSQLQVFCKQTYKLVGSKTLTCGADGRWRGDPPVCKEINCGLPDPIFNGYILGGETTTLGSVIFFGCNIHTMLVGDSLHATCQPDETWSHQPPLCLNLCKLPSLTNGNVISKDNMTAWKTHGYNLTYKCHGGYVPINTKPSKCNNGTWTYLPKCLEEKTLSN